MPPLTAWAPTQNDPWVVMAIFFVAGDDVYCIGDQPLSCWIHLKKINIKINLHFLIFVTIEITHGWSEPVDGTYSIPWLLMPWLLGWPGHHQPWCWPIYLWWIFQFKQIIRQSNPMISKQFTRSFPNLVDLWVMLIPQMINFSWKHKKMWQILSFLITDFRFKKRSFNFFVFHLSVG